MNIFLDGFFFLDVDIGNLLITYMVYVIFLLGHFSVGPDGGKCLWFIYVLTTERQEFAVELYARRKGGLLNDADVDWDAEHGRDPVGVRVNFRHNLAISVGSWNRGDSWVVGSTRLKFLWKSWGRGELLWIFTIQILLVGILSPKCIHKEEIHELNPGIINFVKDLEIVRSHLSAIQTWLGHLFGPFLLYVNKN